MRFVRQADDYDCGTACLAMIFDHHGGSQSLTAAATSFIPVGILLWKNFRTHQINGIFRLALGSPFLWNTRENQP